MPKPYPGGNQPKKAPQKPKPPKMEESWWVMIQREAVRVAQERAKRSFTVLQGGCDVCVQV